MDNFNSLSIDQKVTISFAGDKKNAEFPGKVKKVKDKLLALNVGKEVKASPHFKLGAQVSIRSQENGNDLAYQAKIEKESFPLIVLAFTKTLKALEASSVPVLDAEHKTADDQYVKDRNSARISDSFDIEFYPVDKAKVVDKVKDYTSRPTALRREKGSFTAVSSGDQEMLTRISHADQALVDAISDLYRKIDALNHRLTEAASGQAPGGGGKDDHVGVCVDISGGGLKILVNRTIGKGTVVKLMISPPATPPFSISALGEVMRCSKASDPEHPNKPFELGIKYYAMHEEDKELIIQYTFKLQREMLRLRKMQKGSGGGDDDFMDEEEE